MVERIKEGMTAPIPETKFRVLKTTLAELGVNTSFDSLNLAGDKLVLGVTKVGEDTVFVGLLKRPVAGGHFAQCLNSVSPFPDQDVDGIIDDLDLPIRAKTDSQQGFDTSNSESIHRHERHLNDPRVGPPYRRFIEYHVDKWLKALRNNHSGNLFWVLGRVQFVNDLKNLTDSHFSIADELLFAYDQESYKSLRLRDVNGIDDIAYSLLTRGSQWGCGDFKSLFYDMIGLEKIEDSNRLLKEYLKLTVGQGIELIRTFFERNPDGKQEFVLHYFFPSKQVLVDLENDRLRGEVLDLSLQAKLIDKETLEINDKEGTRFLIVPNKDNVIPWGFGPKVKEYEFSDQYLSSKSNPPLYPIIAWKKAENGKREFLKQEEAMSYVAQLSLPEGEQGDTKLGEIVVAYFARDITKGWERKMTLKPLKGVKSFRYDDFEQLMKDGQMPAWVAVEQHKEQLLRSETSVLAVLEQYSGAAS